MKIDQLEFKAVIPTGQYANVQPGLTLSEVSVEEGTKVGMSFISDLFSRFSEKGGLVDKDAIILASGTKKSFNEDIVIGFDPITHTYSLDGKKLQGVTDYIKKFYSPFDSSTISAVLESKWDVPQDIIKNIWEGNGRVASSFGKAIHEALEFYHNYRTYGVTISFAKGEKHNYVLPKHPVLRSIVEEFIAIDKRKGSIVSEVLLTDIKNGLCGHADAIEIINRQKKICRISDFKINIDSEETDNRNKPLPPFDELPANKLSKYQLQLSVYANMLEKSGWSVQGLDVYVYEDTWKHFPLDVLKVI